MTAWLAAVFALPASAHAATVLAADPVGDVPYSFSDQLDVTAVSVAWTDRLVVRVTYAAPSSSSSRVSLLVSSAARDELNPDVRRCAYAADDSFIVTGNQESATFQDSAIEGSLSSLASWEGNTVTYTFSSSTLDRKYNGDGSDPFVCLDGTADNDDFYGVFDGKAAKLDTAVAEAGIRHEVDKRFGVGRRRTTKVRCLPRGARRPFAGNQFSEATPAMRWCAFEARLPRGGKTMFGGGAVYLGSGRPLVRDYYGRAYPNGTRDCGTTDFSGKWLVAPFPENFGGAFMSVMAKRVSCPTARRLARSNSRHTGAFRCVVTKSGYEYRRTKCSASRGRIISVETGA